RPALTLLLIGAAGCATLSPRMEQGRQRMGSHSRSHDRSHASRRSVLAGASAGAAIAALGWPGGDAAAQAPPAREGRYLLKNGVVLSLDPAVGDFDRADVLIEGRKIAAVRPNITASATVIDASNAIVMPGFADTHHHFYQSALRNLLSNGL